MHASSQTKGRSISNCSSEKEEEEERKGPKLVGTTSQLRCVPPCVARVKDAAKSQDRSQVTGQVKQKHRSAPTVSDIPGPLARQAARQLAGLT